MKSLCDLMLEAFNLSLDLCYGTTAPDGTYLHPRTLPDSDLETTVSVWVDGLVHKYYQNMSTGHCSIQNMIDFDIAKFEESVIKDIAVMQKALTQYGPPRKMTFHEMQIEGYRGSWAGYFPLLTFPGYQPYSAV